MHFPSVTAVAAELRAINRECEEGWAVRWGDASYDQDHRGYWGASSVPGPGEHFDAKDIARDLIEQAKDHHAQGGENPLTTTSKWLIGLAAAGAAALVYTLTKQPTGKQFTVTPASGGQTINAKVGDTVWVKLPAPAAGYLWDGGEQGDSIFTYPSPVTGADGSITNTLTVTSTGNAQIAFAQYDANGNVNASSEVLVTVIAS
jgi:hypothetical protein